MVKGVTRQIILVASPEPELFDQAIFILKEGAGGTGSRELLREARHIAADCCRSGEEQEERFRIRIGPLPWVLLGAGLVGLLWLLTALL